VVWWFVIDVRGGFFLYVRQLRNQGGRRIQKRAEKERSSRDKEGRKEAREGEREGKGKNEGREKEGFSLRGCMFPCAFFLFLLSSHNMCKLPTCLGSLDWA